MRFTFFLGADQYRLGLEAAFAVGVGRLGRLGTDELIHRLEAAFCVDVVQAQEGIFVAAVCVDVLFLAAEGVSLLGNGRKDQHVGGAEHHDAHHQTQDPPPDISAFLPFELFQHFMIKLLLHAIPPFLGILWIRELFDGAEGR
jgi:hypothetical protein